MKATDQAKRERLSELLLKIMQKREWSVNRLAEELGLSAPAVRPYVHGNGYPGEDNRRLIAKKLLPEWTYEELEAYLDGRKLSAALTVEDLCKEVRLLGRSDLHRVARVVFDRLLETDESAIEPGKKSQKK